MERATRDIGQPYIRPKRPPPVAKKASLRGMRGCARPNCGPSRNGRASSDPFQGVCLSGSTTGGHAGQSAPRESFTTALFSPRRPFSDGGHGQLCTTALFSQRPASSVSSGKPRIVPHAAAPTHAFHSPTRPPQKPTSTEARTKKAGSANRGPRPVGPFPFSFQSFRPQPTRLGAVRSDAPSAVGPEPDVQFSA